ncbi:MAG: lipid A biosynthesis lauroyl acyltransferase [Rhizobiales bacterium]|nr:lipid A biosynthesis lauroyl acyltransferase [Hyphomicrobiales bacterium]
MSKSGSRDEAEEAKAPPARKKRRNRRKLSQSSIDRLKTQTEKRTRREAKKRRRESFVGRAGNSEFVQRRLAGAMRFVFTWSRSVGRARATRTAARVTRTLARFSSENALAAANLAAAYPEKSQEERDRILTGVWENLGRQSVEYAFLQDLVDGFDPERPGDGPIEAIGMEHLYALRDSGKPAILFGAHLGNFELTPALGAKLGLPVTALFRPPTNPHIAAEIEKRRNHYLGRMVVSGPGAALEVADALKKGRHIGVLIDQRITGGQVIPFFGRPSFSNPLVGIMARVFNCPVHGGYAVRLPDGRFRVVMTPPLELPRDERGRIDAQGANILVHGMVESWIREYPDQWLWLHDRWRVGRKGQKAIAGDGKG